MHERGIVLRILVPTLALVAIGGAALATLTLRDQAPPDALAFAGSDAAAPSTTCDDGCTREVGSDVGPDGGGANQPPSLTDDLAISRADGAALILDVLANDRDPEGSAVTVVAASVLDGEGTVEVSGNGQAIEFSSAYASIGPWTLSYTAADEQGLTSTAIVSISDGNRPPLPAPDFITVFADEILEIDPLVNDEDEVAGLRIVDATTDVGPLEIIDGRRIEFVAPHDIGIIEIRYTIEDVTGKMATSTVTVEVEPWDPEAVDDAVELEEDSAIDIDVLANDGPELADLDPDSLVVLDATLGEATAVDGTIRFVAAPDATGTAFITYQVCTIHRSCDMAIVQAEILPVNDPPSFELQGDIQLQADAGPQSKIWATNISAGPGESQPVLFSVTTDRPDLFTGAPTFTPQGLLEFTPNPAKPGRATLTVQLFDSEGANAVATFVIALVEPASSPESEG